MTLYISHSLTITTTVVVAATGMEALPTEIVHHIMFSFDTSAADVLNMALTSHTLHATLLGPVGNPNAYDMDQFRAKAGMAACVLRFWPRAADMALSRGYCDPSQDDELAFQVAAEEGWEGVVKHLLQDPRVDPGGCGNKAIVEAADGGYVGIVSLLLADPRVDPVALDDRGMDPLQKAALSDHADVVSLLLADGRIDPCDDDNYALRQAARMGLRDVVLALLADPRSDPRDVRDYDLDTATANGHAEIVELILADPRRHPQ